MVTVRCATADDRWFLARRRCADPLYGAHAGILRAIGYTTPYRWAHYVEAPFQPLRKAARAIPRHPHHDGSAVRSRPRAIRAPALNITAAAKFYSVYDGDTSKTHDLRISHIAYDRVHTSAEDSGTWFPLPQLRTARRRTAHRRSRAAFLRRADQPQPSRDDRDRRAGNSRPLPGRSRRCRGAGAELPGLPPDDEPGRAASRGQRHPDGRDGLRQGYRRTCRGAPIPVLGFPARQLCRQAARRGSQAFTLELALRVLETAPSAQTTVQSPLRWSADPSWKRDYNNVAALERRRAGAAPARIRCPKGSCARTSRDSAA